MNIPMERHYPIGRSFNFTSDVPIAFRAMALWIPILCAILGATAVFLSRGFWMDAPAVEACVWRLTIAVIAVYVLIRHTQAKRIGFAMNAVMQYLVAAIAAMMLTYSAATCNRPLIDGALLKADQFIGYDWRGYAEFVAGHPTIDFAFRIAYASLFVQPIIIIAALAVQRNFCRIELFIIANLVAMLAATAVFAFFPATTAWAHLNIPNAQIAGLHLPMRGSGWIKDLMDLRAGAGRHLTPNSSSGLVAFPSYHCAAAILYLWCAMPLRKLRLIIFAFNICMIAATPIFGGHYLTDLLGGVITALVSIYLAKTIVPILMNTARIDRLVRSLPPPRVQSGEPLALR